MEIRDWIDQPLFPRARVRVVLPIIETFLLWDQEPRVISGNLIQHVLSSIPEPINHAPVEQRRRTRCYIRKIWRRRVHGEHHMQVFLNIFREIFVQLLFAVDYFPVGVFL